MKSCSTCRYLDKGMYGVTGCVNPLAASEDRVRGTVFPVISAPWMMTRDPHGVLDKCDAGNWHTPKKKYWWSL